MRDHTTVTVPKWPFFFGDLLLLGLATFICLRSTTPFGQWEALLYFGCVAVGAGLSILPFVFDYRAAARVAEAQGLSTVVAQVQNLEGIAAQIRSATAQWQSVQESADKTGALAKGIVDRMVAEVKAFNEFIKQADEGERANLRLEVDKLRRAESEWLQVLVRILDHVYALHQAALRSGQSGVIEQLGHFQNACRDAARRIGLTPFVAVPSEPFDEQRHRLAEGLPKPSNGALVEETLATGYTYQGRPLRPAIVRLQSADAAVTEGADIVDSEQSQLPLANP